MRVAIRLPAGARAGAKGVGRKDIRLESEPVEVLEQRPFVLRPATLAVVVFDAQQHPPAAHPRHAPDPDRVHDVAQVQIPGRRRGEPRE
jgi:hypothetical protein